MTIVVQHQFWDLTVTEHAFEIGLSFGGVSERLFVPFTAVVAFEDRSVGFQLHFAPVRPRRTRSRPKRHAAEAVHAPKRPANGRRDGGGSRQPRSRRSGSAGDPPRRIPEEVATGSFP